MDTRAKRALAVLLFAWIAVLFILSRLHRTQGPVSQAQLIELPAYPQAADLERHSSQDGEWQTLQYVVESECPSADIYRFYERELGEAGWHVLGQRTPQWTGPTSESAHDARLTATWLDEEELYRIDVQVQCQGSRRMKVSCGLMRNPLPGGVPERPAVPAGK